MKKYICKRTLELLCHPDSISGFYEELKTYIAAWTGDIFYETDENKKDGLVSLKNDDEYLNIRKETLDEFFQYAGEVKRYVCKKPFYIDHYDDGGYYDTDQILIPEGSVYELSADDYRLIATHESIRLESDDGSWLEIEKETLDKFFEEV